MQSLFNILLVKKSIRFWVRARPACHKLSISRKRPRHQHQSVPAHLATPKPRVRLRANNNQLVSRLGHVVVLKLRHIIPVLHLEQVVPNLRRGISLPPTVGEEPLLLLLPVPTVLALPLAHRAALRSPRLRVHPLDLGVPGLRVKPFGLEPAECPVARVEERFEPGNVGHPECAQSARQGGPARYGAVVHGVQRAGDGVQGLVREQVVGELGHEMHHGVEPGPLESVLFEAGSAERGTEAEVAAERAVRELGRLVGGGVQEVDRVFPAGVVGQGQGRAAEGFAVGIGEEAPRAVPAEVGLTARVGGEVDLCVALAAVDAVGHDARLLKRESAAEPHAVPVLVEELGSGRHGVTLCAGDAGLGVGAAVAALLDEHQVRGQHAVGDGRQASMSALPRDDASAVGAVAATTAEHRAEIAAATNFSRDESHFGGCCGFEEPR